MRNKIISGATFAAVFLLSVTPAFAMNSSSEGGYPKMINGAINGAEQLPPVSANASNITASDTKSDIAPPLPLPPVGSGASPLRYLRTAKSDLSRNQTGAAQQALEMAETRLLDRSVVASRADEPDASPVIGHISEALDSIGKHNLSAAQDQIDLAMSSILDHRTA